MTLSLIFDFVAGRYHATPYGYHVNEGMIEWPPSPWRLLRTLISVGYTYGYWDHTGPSSTGRSILYKLASELPRYRLPYATSAHSRHYMPISTLDAKDIESTTLVFDTWANVHGKLAVIWDGVDISEDELPLLVSLVESIPYLGRSESWVVAKVADSDESVSYSNCNYEQPDKKTNSEWEPVSLLSPISPTDYAVWLEGEVQHHATKNYPTDLLECLQMDTSSIRDHGWNRPPGSRHVSYWRSVDAIAVINRHIVQRPIMSKPKTAILLSITHPNYNDHALPNVTRTLPQAETLHRKLVGTAAQMGMAPPVLTGCDECHNPLQNSHAHAHINPLDLDNDGHLDHILIWTTTELGADAQAVIRRVRRINLKNNTEHLRLAPVVVGDLHDLNRLPGLYGTSITKLIGESATWQSLTPLVFPRHVKKRGKNTFEGQINAELVSRGLPEPVNIEILRWMPTNAANRYWERFRHFVTSRRNGPPPPTAQGFALRLFFDHEIAGPIAIGYGSHFGLGLFCHDDISTHVGRGGA